MTSLFHSKFAQYRFLLRLLQLIFRICSNFPTCFATASFESIRIWSTTKMQELLRIRVPNFTSKSVIFSRDGKSVISAWNDGVIFLKFYSVKNQSNRNFIGYKMLHSAHWSINFCNS